MGGISNALQNDSTAPFNINSANPASLASTRLTIFDFGVIDNSTQISSSSQNYITNRTGFAYATLVIPVAKWWGSCIGLRPYSDVGYNILTQQTQNNIGQVNYSYTGQGGINQLFWGNGFKIKNLYVGANLAFLFGNFTYTSRDSFPTSSYFLNTKYLQKTAFNDLYYSFGLQYKLQFRKGWSVTLGATGSMQTSLNTQQTTLDINYMNVLGVEVDKDTNINATKNAKIIIPMTIGGGIVIKKSEKLLVGLDYSVQDWSSFNSFGEQGLLKNSQKVAIGIQYIPDKNAGRGESYAKKIFYRVGFRYADSYLDLNNTPLKEYTLTFGAGFPLRKYKVGETYSQSVVNLAVEMGQLGTTTNELIRERYMRVVVGFTLNDRWFIKRKYD